MEIVTRGGGIGANYVVADNTEKGNLVGLQEGDLILNLDNGSGKWEFEQVTVVTDGDYGTSTTALVASETGINSFDYAQTIWVRTNGDDAEDGLNPKKAVATPIQAHTLAAALSPSATNRIAIKLAPGEYIIDDLLELEQYIDLIGPEANVQVIDDTGGGGGFGELYYKGNNVIKLNKFYDDSAALAVLFHLEDGGGRSYIELNEHISPGGNALTFDVLTSKATVHYKVGNLQGVNDVMVQVPNFAAVFLEANFIQHTVTSGIVGGIEASGTGVIHANINNYTGKGISGGTAEAFCATGGGTIIANTGDVAADNIWNVNTGSTLKLWTNTFTGATPTALGTVEFDYLVKSFSGAGTIGRVPDPVTATGKFLKDNGTWDTATAPLSDVLTVGNDSSGNNIDMTTTDAITFNAASHSISAADTNVLTIAANKGLLVTAQNTEMSYGTNVLDLKNTSTNSFIRLGYTDGSIAINDGNFSGNISIPTLTAGRTWTLPDKTGTLALVITATSKVANYTAVSGDFVLMTTGAVDRTVSLPAAASNINAIIEVKKIDSGAGNVIIDAGAELIDGANTQTITAQYTSLTLHSDGTQWWIK